MMTDQMLQPGSTIGILGGGQLGRMLAMAAARLGLRCYIYAPEDDPPAAQVADRTLTAAWDDLAALSAFAESVDVITYEFENVPITVVDHLISLGAIVRPGRLALATAQERVAEKTFLNGIGITTAPWRAVTDLASLRQAREVLGPGILKTCRNGYDGKGQLRINGPDDLVAAQALLAVPCIYEGFVPFVREISVIGARGTQGQVICYDPSVNTHENGILRRSVVPAPLRVETAFAAIDIVTRMLDELDYVGVIGVEMFEMKDGALWVNEFAPRVHNTGHWTIEACVISQFEQHIRAVAGWPLGDPMRHSDAEMVNLIGDEIGQVESLAREPLTGVHHYGKAEVRAGRKMGHYTRLRPLGGV